ncbi:MAG: 5-formyltetrahydrofolate cyclo-ligase [Desulfovibrio sp.]|nr:5-formyltetrahydrofolate cyclo-ligase [Desulfovibrio sp.]
MASATDSALTDEILHSRTLLRKRMKALRAALSSGDATACGLAAQKHLLSLDLWSRARSVALYVSVRDEMPTSLLLQEAWASEREVWLPRLRAGQPGKMDFVRCSGKHDLRPGPFGLWEPKDDLPGCGPGESAFVPDCMILPGLAFDMHGGRLGYGGGYYDRFLASGWPCTLVGLCFDFQLLQCLPLAPWDRPVHCICTEERDLCL